MSDAQAAAALAPAEPGAVAAPLQVVGAAVVRAGRVLAARRRAPAGMWEFPGGKVEQGEDPAAALVRECAEELTVRIEALAPVAVACSNRVRLEIWHARLAAGDPAPGADHDDVRWLGPAELESVTWLPLDRDVLAAVRGLLGRSLG